MSRNILAEIVSHKREEVNLRKQRQPLVNFKAQLTPSDRSLQKALSHNRADFILECKKASPSKGLIRKNFDLDEILDQYQDYASAISVLTDNKYFQGNHAYLKRASARAKQPILCKDFFIDSYQIYEARFYGADAILLMLSVLDDATYKGLTQVAESLNLDILTEVHNESELQRAIALNAKIIGINNRDLTSLNVDLATTEKLANQIPDDRIVISESGIRDHQDVKRLTTLVDGFLVGSSIMGQQDIRHHCKSLIFGNVKICGLTKPQDAIEVDKNGGNYAGLIFYPKSKRYISFETAHTITRQAPLRYVGVFVNENIETVITYARGLKLFAVQLHGDESDEYIDQLRKNLQDTQIWKAKKATTGIQLSSNQNIDRFLLDADCGDAFGGSGQSFDWQILNQLDSSDVILAGGINLSTIKSAVAQNTFAIDLSSGVESEPGVKSPQKIAAIFAQLRA